MLPFDNRPWAKRVAALVIICTVVCEVSLYLWLRTEGPVNFSELLAFILFFLAVVPPNIHIIRAKRDQISLPTNGRPVRLHSAPTGIHVTK